MPTSSGPYREEREVTDNGITSVRVWKGEPTTKRHTRRGRGMNTPKPRFSIERNERVCASRWGTSRA
jgi:hypothetical protein